MENINIWIIVSTVVFLIILWAIVAFRHLKHLKLAVLDQWELVDENLRKRHDLLPNLIETIRMYTQTKEDLAGKIIEIRAKTAHENGNTVMKIEFEHELSGLIKVVFALGKELVELGRDTNLLELRTEIQSLENNIELKVGKYNEMVRYYNGHLRLVFLLPIATIFNFKNQNIFEFEG